MSTPQAGISAADRQRAFEILLRQRGIQPLRSPSSPLGPAPRREPGAELLLSFAQQRLWFIDQLDPGNPAYNMPSSFRFEGALDVPLLERVLSEVVRRHEILRTTYGSAEGGAFQVIAPAAGLRLPAVDLRGLRPEAREEEARRLAGREAARPFDLAAGPVLRLTFLKLAPQDHLLLATIHHIAYDAWSADVLWREVTSLYAAWLRGRPSPLPELPLQYVDFAIWQRDRLAGEAQERQMAYWRQCLAGSPAVLELPTDRPRPPVQTFRGSILSIALPAPACRGLLELGTREGATPFMTFLALFQALLRRYSGQSDIAVGTPVSGRHRVELEGLIGLFLNTLVLRVDLPGDPGFRPLLDRVRALSLEAFAHQDLPFERLVDELQPQRSLSHTPLFQVLFVLLHTPPDPGGEGEPGLRARPYEMEAATAKFDLTLSLVEAHGLVSGTIEYNSDLFDRTTIQRLARHLRALAQGIAEVPDRRLSELPLLSEPERVQLLVEWNDTGTAAVPRAGVQELFTTQVRRTPDAVAVVCGDAALTYAGLAGRAGSLSLHLRQLGVGPDVLVGLFVERSLDMVIGVLGILQAGGAYVPLDPGYPEQRLAFMLADTSTPVVLTQEPLRGRLPAGHSEILLLAGGAIAGPETPATLATAVPPDEPSAENLAYVIYTSGSTGKPKGVALSRGALRNLIDWHLATLLGGVRTLQLASMSFDASFHEMFACWGSGGTLVVVAEELRRDMAALATLLVEQQIEKAIVPVVALTQLAETFAGRKELPPLCEITTTGERLQTNRTMAAFLERLPGCAFHNHYGPSETHVATAFTLPPDPTDWAVFPFIGRPIWSSSAHVLEPGLVPAPLGIAGDLYLGGACVARGYLERPDLTAERFVPDPYGDLPGGRLYRTGDKVRRAAGGELEYLGRFDDQVKIRGFRIEPVEIEEALLALPGVREAVVLAREDRPAAGSADRRLVAYVVGDTAANALREALRDRLPDYMVPAAFVTLAALPLTPNGKVDKKALPVPEQPSSVESYLAPRTPLEEVLAGIWTEVLGIERVGAADSFFDLGGHSLLATQVVSRLRSAFGIELPLRDLFAAPRLADLAVRVEEALRSGAREIAPPLVPRPREGAVPLSFAQQRLWFIDQLEPGTPLYNIPVALGVEGPLDRAVLARCLGEIVRRHEALRTVFTAQDGAPVQVIQPTEPFLLPMVDLSGLPETTREGTVLHLVGEEAGRAFDLARGPMLRGLLLRMAQGDHVAAFTMHHIASDGWSMGILVREVAALYPALAAGRPSPLPELPVQYADFSVWQRSWLSGEVLENEIAFWRRQLAGLPPLLELPTDRPRPALQSVRGANRPVRLPAGLTRQLEALARREGATLFMVLLAGFQALLARYSGQDDLAVGSPIAGRNRMEIEDLIGFFVNTLVLRGDLSGEPSFHELLGRARETALSAYVHQDVPFEKLVDDLAPERSLAHTPLFQVMLVLQNAPLGNLEIEGLRLRPVSAGIATAKFDLTVNLTESDGELAGSVEYATDLFDAATIDRLVNLYERLLAAALAEPKTHVAELLLLAAAERDQILLAWSGAATTPAGSGCLHELFETQVARTPEATALIAGEERWTYDALNCRANRLAHHLRRLGVGPEQRVGVAMRRSAELVAALLAVLKAGAAYVPLDPAYPDDWRTFAAEDARITFLLTEAAAEDSSGEFEQNPQPLAGPGNLAYVLYTSGSTGRPKGVAIEHRAPVERMLWARDAFSAADLAGVLAATSVCFDLSVFEIFAPLSWGGTVILADHALALPMLPAREEVTLLNTVPSAMAELASGALPPRLRTVNLAGEPLPPALVERIYRHPQVEQVFNLYGPTEDATYSTWAQVVRGASRVSIGCPLPGTRAYVLDRHIQPVPGGVVGELYLAGAGGARGYLGRPELTAERFFPNPFTAQPGGRLYRTGDLARWLAAGELEHMGRLDHQVKVRGFRIELGEIEAVLVALPGVREAVVVTREIARSKALVAYMTGEETPPAADELRQLLRRRLPEHMIPAFFVALAKLPLTPNGKVDRKALPAPGLQSSEESYVAPRTPLEEVLAGIWAEVLGIERVGAADSFFDLGGHSLLATQVVSRLRSAFGIELPLRDLFAAPRLVDLAVRVEEALRSGTREIAPSLVPRPREGAVPLSFAQQRLWFIDQLEPGTPLYNIPVALGVEGPLDRAVLALSLGEIVRRHEALRTVFTAQDGAPVQVIQPTEPFLLPMVDLSGLPETTREGTVLHLVGEEAGRAFDLARGPMLRGLLLRMAQGDHVAAFTMHHIASDGWSMGILVREVVALYPALAAGWPSPLPELPVQYADFSIWQRSWLSGEVLENEIAWWRKQLAGLPPLLELPTDRPRPALQSVRGANRPVRLPAGLTRQLEALARREGATLFMVLLAGFQALLARYSGQDDLAVGSPIAGRNRVEIEDLIGFFVNTLVLRGDLSGEPSFHELLGRARETALSAYVHQDVPFEKLVDDLAPERSLAQTPLFQVMLVLQNAPLGNLEIEGLRLRPVSAGTATAKFDLTMGLTEHSGVLTGEVEHATDLFDGTTIDRLVGHFERLLAAALETPERRIAELPLLSEPERVQLLVEWNDTGTVAVPRAGVQELFATQARRTPDAVAVVCGDAALTYAGLAGRAGRLALHLRQLGVGPDVLVGLFVERSLDMLIGVLGILQAGGAYVPLDPGYPEQRLAFMLADTRTPVVLTQEPLRGRLPAGHSEILLLAGGAIAGETPVTLATAVPPDEPSAENLAYVIYTSGSTGKPKGVALSRGALRNLIDWHLATLLGGVRTLQLASMSFDASFHEMFACWGSGGTLVVVAEELRRDMAALATLLVEQQIEKAIVPVVVLTQLAETFAGRTELPPLCEITTTGERLQTNRTMAAFLERLPGCAFHNHYGPSETHVATAFTLPPDPADWAVFPFIGRPIWSSSAHVLEPALVPSPLGIAGDLYLGGACVARGYLERPDLTAERFVPDPYGDLPGGRLYRTGDKVRRAAGGELEYLGRFDDQVKIRGFRIEPVEIEEALLALPGVREAVVLAREDRPAAGSADRRLVAYVVGDTAANALREALRDRLPDYMVPAAFVTLAALPLTPNGKVDKKALPVPEQPSSVESYLAPRTPLEEVLAGIWAEVLGIERVGAADSFFDLGGHSLLATQVVSRLRSAFGIELPLRDLFAAPRLADLAVRVEEALRSGAREIAPPLVPRPREGAMPLSFAQQRLWFIDQLEPGTPLYNIPVALGVEGPLDRAVLALSLGEIVRRHEALRTVFTAQDGAPAQVIQPTEPFLLPMVDLSGLPETTREGTVLHLVGEEAGRAFDLARGPMLRGLLLRMAQGDHVAAFTMHHIASDGWSMGILVREVATLYPALAAGRPSPLPKLPVQYADFSVWQRSWLSGEVLENEIAFWRRQLAGLPPLLELPTDRPRPAVQSFRGANRPVRLPAGLTRQLEALARREGATLFMVLLAGFQALLARYSGQDDLAVGSPIAGRNRVEIEDLIGFFVNTLVLRGDLSGEPSFHELLGRARETALSAYVHQDVPFEKLVDDLAPERSLAQTPLFQVMLVLQNAPLGNLEIEGLRLRPVSAGTATAKFDLTMGLTEHSGVLTGEVEHATDLFDGTTIDRLVGHFERLLAAALETPERRIAELPLLSEPERVQLLVEWNDTGTVAVPRADVQELFATQARRTPDAVAVVCGDAALTYAGLAGRAGRLALHLRQLGVDPDVLVGLFVERSLDMLIGVLGILQAGGAYVPLDPGYPEQRLAFMLADTRTPVVLTQEPLRGRLPTGHSEILLLAGGAIAGETPATLATAVPPDEPSAENLAYVIYTSGSTGKPKGVALSRGALRNLIDWHLATLLGGMRTLQLASMSFDVSFLEMFACWGSGGTLVVVAEELRRDMAALATLLVEQQIEKAIVPVVVLTQLAETFAGRTELPPLCEITTTGERLQTNRTMAAFLERLPGCAFHNHYGPSETHVATAFTLPPDPADWAVFPFIGRPIWSSSAHVLEPALVPSPLGIAGDLYLGGACVARGYLERPDLTAERFVPDPYGDLPGGRLYRTGDKVRRAAGGELEYLGRFDDQVKIRGFRIEPVEIEEALLALPGVREAVVLAREDRPAAGSADRRLVAYVVGDTAANALREALRDRLPDYMVPAAFVTLAALPLTPNGKVDKKALPVPEQPSSVESYLAPRTPLEEVLAGIWAEVLGIERVGAADSFFDLGGHSLLATQVVSRLRSAFGIELPLRDLFAAPRLADLAVRVEEALRSGAREIAPPLVPRPREGAVPLSFAQQRLWFIDQLEPGTPLYNIPVALGVEGPLDRAVLALSLGEIVRRHEALRTVFTAQDGAPAQVIQPTEPFLLPMVDLSGLPETTREGTALHLVGEEAGRAFDLARGPMLRGLLLRMAQGDHVAAFTIHHIASDGWSMGILVREVAALYPALAAGWPSPLPELPVQYADFSVWQRSWLSGEVLENEIAFWRRQLAGLPPLLELPTDRPRPALQSVRGANRPVRLVAGLTRQLEALARREGATLFIVLLAGFQALLARYSGQDDLAVGSPIAGRNRMEIEDLIGFFVNTLVLRGDLSGEPSFHELLDRARETALSAYVHQDVPFERLVDDLAPERSLAHTPLFQVMLVLQNAPLGNLEIEGLRLRPVSAGIATAKFDLTMSLTEHSGGLSGEAEHATDLFDGSTIDRLVGHFERLLAAALEAPERRIAELPLMSNTERVQTLVEWNDTGTAAVPRAGAWSGAATTPAGSGCLHELFEAQVARTPEAIALIAGEERWTYDALNRRANRLAHHLRRLGMGPEQRVGIAMRRSAELVAALLAVLKAGAAYVPLDPAYPDDWRTFAAEDAHITFLLTEGAVEGASGEFEQNPQPLAGPGNLAYVLYTSGSTGRPKGVAIEHRAPVERMLWARDAFSAADLAGVLAATSVCFDLSVFEIFAPLSWGGTVILADHALALPMLPAREEVTLLNTVPSAMAELAAGSLPPRLRTVNLAGEPLPPALVERIYQHPQVEQVFNLYGPTEDATYSTWAQVVRGASRVSIGRPLPGTRAYVLDRHIQPVPGGVVGELYLAGAGGARGYLGRPELTAERFFPNPFTAQPGGRLYRTGDLARWLAAGELEHMGRLDYQVKVRGFRIELGEIEAVLVALPGVREAVVVTREIARSKALVAYMTGEETPPAADELRQLLRRRLPEHMIPAFFVALAKLPLTPNGKVDRKALPAPGLQSSEESYVVPRTPLEEVLAGIWAEVLGIERVGAADSFFDLGGHSLLATQVVSRLRSAFGIELPLRDLFAAPRLVDLAVRVEEALRSGTREIAPSLVPRPREGAVPLSFAQQRLWFIDQLEPGTPLYNIPVALGVEGPLDRAVLALSLGEIVRRHEALRTVFTAQDGAPVQVIQPTEPFLLPMVDLSGLPETTREGTVLHLVGEEAGRAFDLARGPMLRGLLLRMAQGDHVAAFTMHHIASDGWSMGILVREVVALYPALAAGWPSPLPELPVQYADFSIWQRSWLSGEVLENEIAWWRKQLAGLPPLLELPTDRPRPALQSVRGANRPVRLPAGLTRQLEALARREGATLFMVLLAGFQALLARYSGQDDLAVGSPIAGRNRVEIEDLIGFFVNTLVLRGDLSGEPSFHELLGRARETALSAYVHQDVPFEKLVDDLAPERSLAQTPLFQVMLVLQNAPLGNLEIEGLRLRPVSAGTATAKFDLTMSLTEHGGGLTGTIAYAIDLFDLTTIDRLTGQLERLLAGMADRPDEPAPALPLLSTAERAQLLREWNDTRAGEPGKSFFHREVATQAERTPGAVAVETEDERWTYGGLVTTARRLALRLRELGIGPDAVVGLCAGRTPAMIAGLLAVLEAGGAWLPLDPDEPPERLRFLLDDAGARALLVAEPLRERVPADGRPVVLLEAHGGSGEEPAAPLRVELAPDHLAYVLYTSGSTGRPKGVAVRHGSLMHLARALRATVYAGTAGSLRVGVNASFSFDGAVKQVVQLAWGHTLHILSREVRLDPPALVDTVRRQRLDVLDCTPSQLRLLLEAGLGLDDAAPALVLVGGEAVDAELHVASLSRPRTRFWNLYGPTECTVDTTAVPFAAGVPPSHLGRPLPNIQTHVVAAGGDLVPLGVAGELQVGGAGLARGYLHRPGLTAERFVPDPFDKDGGGRLYRTGDLVRRLSDGSLDFLGRIDHQVKIRGFRIELGEIEALLAASSGVREAVVVAREDAPGDRRLVAYVAGDVDAEALRRPLRERLPDYMVPAAFVLLPALPRTPNGKVDRKALPAPEPQPAGESHLAPRTPVEEVLAGIWAELLGVERIGADGHFFDLGGHSLLATQVMSRLRRAFGVEMPLRDLFEAPTLAELGARVEAALRAGEARLLSPLAPIDPGLRQGPLPLSFAQQRLWFIDQLEPGSPLYNIPVALGVEGPLDRAVLALCLVEIVRRHEALRTVFTAQDGAPAQVIQPTESFLLPMVDLSGLPETTREGTVLHLVGEEAGRAFDLARGPMLRGLLLRMAQGDHVAAFTMHHIASDGWSMGILVREVAALYPALAAGRPSPLPELPVQYADFSVWQRSWLSGEVLENEIAFWRRQLAGLPPLLELPTDRPRPAVQSFRGANRPVRLVAGLTRQLEALARREGATLFMVLLAGFQTILARYSGQDDLTVGSPIAGRNRVEIEDLIGFFVNTLVLRGDLSREPSFHELLGRARETALSAYVHQDVPFERLIEELAPERSLAHAPLFQVMLALQNAAADSLEIPDLRLRPAGGAGTTAKFDLTLSLTEHSGGLSGGAEHATDLFDATTIERLLLQYETLLTAALATPELPVSELPLLGAAERHQLLVEWGGAGGEPPTAPTLHGHFEARARQVPEATALTCDGVCLSYGELNRRSNQLARRLRQLGAGPEHRVGLCLERSLDLVVGILGALKAGGAYVPLDPGSPRERLAYVIEDAGIRTVVTTEPAGPTLPGTAGTILLDADRRQLETLPGGDLEPLGDGESLAYVIYTSGSTGRPKGVLITHGNVARLFEATEAWLGFGERDVWTLFHSYAFDFSVWEIWGALFYGGRLVVVPWDVSRSPGLFLDLLTREQVTVLNQTPSAFAQLAREDAERGGVDTDLRLVIFGGEALDLASLAPWFARHGDAQPLLVNMYGITETTVHVTFRPLRAADARDERCSVIGGPLPDLSLAVMDARLQPVPIGVSGELVVGGAGLARGYLGRPELTAARFVPDPAGGSAGARLYRSGDLGRCLPLGGVEYLGRIDHQVKIRGFRIELGEIEVALARLPGVREAVVMVREDGAPGARRLVAYVVGDASSETLRGALRERLPDYMVPAAFVTLAELPLTANDKVDRKALPAPEQPSSAESYVAPRTPVEEALAGIWAELLGLERVGAADSFFDLGGHSLLGVRLMARIERVFGVKLPIATLFAAPAVEQLARLLQNGETAPQRSPLVQLHPGGTGRPLFVVHAVGGDVFAYVGLAKALGTGRPVYGLQAVASSNGYVPTIEELAAHYLGAVQEAQPDGPYVLAGWSLGAVIAYEMAQQIERSGGAVGLLAMLDPSAPQAERRAGIDETALLAGFAADLVRLSGRQVAYGPEVLAGLDLEAGIDRLLELGRSESVLPPDVDRPQLRERFDRFSLHMKALHSYMPAPYGGRVALFRASASLAPEKQDATSGWSALTHAEVRVLEADHYSLLQRPALDRLVEHLQRDLELADI